MPSRRDVALASLVAGVLALSASGCGEDAGDAGRSLGTEPAASADTTVGSGHLGRVHLILQPTPDELEPEPQLQIHGRFVEYRGASEAFVRARTNLAQPAWEQLFPGQCVASESLLPTPPATAVDLERELSMIDAGDLRVQLGGRELVAGMTLVPDILPWLAGVEYVHVDDRLPSLAVDPDGTAPVLITVDGSPDGSLESFSVGVSVPEAFNLEAASVGDDGLTIAWRPPGRGVAGPGNIVLHLQAFAPVDDGLSEPRGEEVTCLVADTGRASLALAPLAKAGLDVESELLRVSASRFDATRVRAGAFGEVEVFVELRVLDTLPLAGR